MNEVRNLNLRVDDAGTQGNFTGALEGLLNIEKQQRLGEDITGTKKACTAVLELLLESKQWKQLNEHILLLSKRRSQLKQVLLYPLLIIVKLCTQECERIFPSFWKQVSMFIYVDRSCKTWSDKRWATSTKRQTRTPEWS